MCAPQSFAYQKQPDLRKSVLELCSCRHRGTAKGRKQQISLNCQIRGTGCGRLRNNPRLYLPLIPTWKVESLQEASCSEKGSLRNMLSCQVVGCKEMLSWVGFRHQGFGGEDTTMAHDNPITPGDLPKV